MGTWEAKQRPTPSGRDPLFCQPNRNSVFSLVPQLALPADLELRGLGVVGEAGEWVTHSGVVVSFCVPLQELMELF